MGLLDGLFNGLGSLIDILSDILNSLTDPEISDTGIGETIGEVLLSGTVIDEFAEIFIESFEQVIAENFRTEGELTPQNIQGAVDGAEGDAAAVFGSLAAGASALEAASLGQIDQHTEYITQAALAFGFEDISGLELRTRIEEGALPALEAQVNREHVSKFADLPDAIEILLRNKTADSGFVIDSNASARAQQLVRLSDEEPGSNLIKHYGLDPEQASILEEVAIQQMEFEELIEQPAELGLQVPDDILQDELDRAGYAEDLKEFLTQVNTRITQSERFFDELTAVRPVIDKLDTLVQNGELTPTEAQAQIPSEVSDASTALGKRFQRIESLNPGAPTQAKLVDAFSRGKLSLSELILELEDGEFTVDQHRGVLDAIVIGELDGSLQESVALGLVSENEFSNLCATVGLDQETTDLLLQGQSFSDITSRRLEEQADPAELPVSAIQGIGESREQALGFEDIETLAQLAQASVETVASATNVTDSTAEGWISAAQQAIQ
jgi:hypothetical protein